MADEHIIIAVLAGTVRAHRSSIHAARYVAEFGQRYTDVEIVFVDPADLQLPDEGEDGKDPRYTEITARADAFFIVTPEYNHSFPGSLKRMLDSEYVNYKHKAVAFAGVSSGNWGGVRAIQGLIAPLRKMGLAMTAADVHFPNVDDEFDADGQLKPEYVEQHEKNLAKAYKELIWMAKTLRMGRELDGK